MSPSAGPGIAAFGRFLVLALVLGLPLGCGGSDSNGPEVPTVALTAPTDGATVSGSVRLEAAAEHCDRVRFYVDGVEIAADADSPYLTDWNSGTVANGSHTLKAKAEGGGGTAEDAIGVTVDNAAGIVVVTVSPAQATVEVGHTQQFTAVVTGHANTAVTWSVDEGAARGTVSPSGLFTAPTALPTPATATVRATSQADPSRSATATVTLTGGNGTGISAEERALSKQLFAAAHEAAQLGTDAVELAAEAVWGASELKGSATLTGTLTQTAPNSDVWTYSASPTDKLVVVFAGGPTVEFAFTVFDGYTEGSWEDFVARHTLDFTTRITGEVDIRVQSSMGYVGGAEVPYTWKEEWDRSVTGTAVYEGATMTLDLSHTGTQQGFNEPGWVGLEHEERILGQGSSPSAQITVDEYYWSSYTQRSDLGHIIRNWQMTVNSSATAGGATYEYDTASARWEANTLVNDPGAFNRVVEPDYWRVMGTLLKNGQVYGQLDFDGPVVKDTNGPSLILRYTNGETLFLHTLVPDPGL